MTKRVSYILFLIATVIWGFAFVAQKVATVLPAFAVGAMRCGIAMLFLALILPLTDKLTKNGRKILNEKHLPDFTKTELLGGALLGVIISVATAFQQIGLEDTDAGKAAFITTLYVVLVPMISIFFGKRPSINVWIAVPISIIGFYFLCIKPGVGIMLSDLLILACALVFSFHIIAVSFLSPRCDGVRMSLIQFAVAFVINSVISLIFEGIPSGEAMIGAMPALIFLGIGSSGIAYTLQIIGQANSDASVASIILSLESVFGVIGAAIVLHERMSPRGYIGCAIVFVAVLIAQLEPEFVQKTIKRCNKANNT